MNTNTLSVAAPETRLAPKCVCTQSGELGIALSGGGARAMAQLGVLKVLDRARIPGP